MSAPHNAPASAPAPAPARGGKVYISTRPLPGVFGDDDDDDDDDDDEYGVDEDDDCAICRMLREANADTQEHQLGDGSVVTMSDMSAVDTATLDKIMSLMSATDDLELHPPRKSWPPSFQGRRKFKRK